MFKPPVYSKHVFRASVADSAELPLTAPKGRHFYLATSPCVELGTKKRYFVAAPKGKDEIPKILTSLNRGQGMKFTNLRLAESFADFVNNHEIFPAGMEFWITVEPDGYDAVPPRLQPICLAEADA